MAKVELTPAKLAEIKKKAEAASSNSDGRWGVIDNPHTGGWGLCIHDQGDIIARATGRDKNWKTSVFNHIAAADPATVLAMVQEIERFRHFVRETLDELHECYNEESCKICKEIDRVIESDAGQ